MQHISSLQKIILFPTLFILIATSVFVGINTPSANAAASGSVVIVGSDLTRDPKEGIAGTGLGLDAIGWAVTKIMIAALTQSIVNWINSGFEGDPLFVSNPEAFFGNIINETTGLFIHELGLETSFLCDPYRPEIMIGLLETQLPFAERYQCTILDIVDNLDAFYEDFSQGGWEGWVELTQVPENNIYGSYLIAQEELARRQRSRVHQQEQELIQFGGFLAYKKCTSYVDTGGVGQITGNPADLAPGPAAEEEGTCASYEYLSPGSAIGQTLYEALGSPFDQFENADEIFEQAVAAIFNALVNQFVLEGLRALSGSSSGGGDSVTGAWYEGGLSEQKSDLLANINEDIATEERKLAAADKTAEGLIAVRETRQCYEEQKAIVKSPGFNPPNDHGIPTEPELNEKIARTTQREEQVRRLVVENPESAAALAKLELLEDLRERVELAQTPAELADAWVEYDAFLEREGYAARTEDRENSKKIDNGYDALGSEHEECHARLEELQEYDGRESPPSRVCVINLEGAGECPEEGSHESGSSSSSDDDEEEEDEGGGGDGGAPGADNGEDSDSDSSEGGLGPGEASPDGSSAHI